MFYIFCLAPLERKTDIAPHVINLDIYTQL